MFLSSLKLPMKGFTIIEILIALVILAILASLGVPAFGIMINNTRIRTTAEGILDGLQTARAEAIRRNSYTQFTLGPGAAWTITRVAPPIVGLEEGGVAYNPCDIVETLGSAVSEASSATTLAVTPAGLTRVNFTPMGWVDAQCGASIEQIRVDSSALSAADSRELDILIRSGGGIRLCDPQVATGDPRSCNV